MQNTGFIIPSHDRNESGIAANRIGQMIEIDDSVLVKAQPGDLEPFIPFQVLDRVQNTVMLGLHADQMFRRSATSEAENPEVA